MSCPFPHSERPRRGDEGRGARRARPPRRWRALAQRRRELREAHHERRRRDRGPIQGTGGCGRGRSKRCFSLAFSAFQRLHNVGHRNFENIMDRASLLLASEAVVQIARQQPAPSLSQRTPTGRVPHLEALSFVLTLLGGLPFVNGQESPVRWPAPGLTDQSYGEWLTFIRPREDELGWREVRWHKSLSRGREGSPAAPAPDSPVGNERPSLRRDLKQRRQGTPGRLVRRQDPGNGRSFRVRRG